MITVRSSVLEDIPAQRELDLKAAAKAAGLVPARIAVMTDEKVIHADRPIHQKEGKALSSEQYKKLSEGFAKPEAVYWDAVHGNALYILSDPDPEWCVIMPLNMPTRDKKTAKRHGRLDGLATAYRWPRIEVRKNVNNGTLKKITP